MSLPLFVPLLPAKRRMEETSMTNNIKIVQTWN